MPDRVPGQQIFDHIAVAAAQFRQQAEHAAAERDRAVAELESVTTTQEAVLTRLAEMMLPSLDHNDVMQTHSGVRNRLRELASRRQRSEEELAARRRRLEDDLTRREAALAEANAAFEDAAAALKARRDELEAFLASNDGYQQMQTACDQIRARLDQDRARLDEVEQDAAEKLPDYNESSLFQYLLRRGYSTPEYRERGLAKSLDRRVARLVDFPSLWESYRFLTTVPDLMKQELQQREQEADELVAQLLEAVKSAEATFGLAELDANVRLAEQDRDRAVSDHARAADNVQTVIDQLGELRSRENRFYHEAIEEMKRFLSGVETEILERKAAATDTYADDDAVAELRSCRLNSESAASAVDSSSEQADQAAQLADGLDFVLRRSKQTDLGTDRTFFPKSFDVDEPLRQFEKGVIDRKRFLEVLKSEADIDPTWAEKAYQKGAAAANSQTVQILMGTAAAAAQPLIQEALRRRMR